MKAITTIRKKNKNKNKTSVRRKLKNKTKNRKRGGAVAAAATVRNGAIIAANTVSGGIVSGVENVYDNTAALKALKSEVKYVLVSIENCYRLLDYLHFKKVETSKKLLRRRSIGGGAGSKTTALSISHLVCNPELESQLRELMTDLIVQLNNLRSLDSELNEIITKEVTNLNQRNAKRHIEIKKIFSITVPAAPAPPAAPAALAAPAPPAAPAAPAAPAPPAEIQDDVLVQSQRRKLKELQYEVKKLEDELELAEILKNESHHPRLATLTEMSSMFSISKTKRTKITLYEYIVKALGLKPKTETCEALLSEYNTHYADVTSSSEFMNKLQAWFQAKLIEKEQNYDDDDVIYIFNSKENSQNHKELLYLFYTFLEQFNDPSTASTKTNAMDKIVSLLRTPQLVPSLLQAIIHTNNVKTRVTTLQNDISNLLSGAVGESEDEVKLFGRVKRVAVKASKVTGKVLKNAVARSNVISARAAMQTTMLNLNTVYQSLLFQVMTLLNEESKPVSSCKKYDTDIFENI